MALGTSTAIIGAGLLGAGASYISGREAADEVSDASANSNAEARRQFNTMIELNQPMVDARDQFLNLRMMQFGMAPQGSSVTGGNAVNAFAPDYGQYVQDNPGVAQAWNSNSHGVQSRFPSQNAFGEFHYNTYGRNEPGRNLSAVQPPASTPGSVGTGVYQDPSRDYTGIPGADPGMGHNGGPPMTQQDQSYQNFIDSPHAKAMLETTSKDMDNYMGAAGAAGTAFSGAALKDLNKINRGNTYNAFSGYNADINAMLGIGQGAAQQSGAAGMNFASMTAQNNMNAANANAQNYMNIGNTIGQIGQLGAYGSGAGWFGGGGGNAFGGFGGGAQSMAGRF